MIQMLASFMITDVMWEEIHYIGRNEEKLFQALHEMLLLRLAVHFLLTNVVNVFFLSKVVY